MFFFYFYQQVFNFFTKTLTAYVYFEHTLYTNKANGKTYEI